MGKYYRCHVDIRNRYPFTTNVCYFLSSDLARLLCIFFFFKAKNHLEYASGQQQLHLEKTQVTIEECFSVCTNFPLQKFKGSRTLPSVCKLPWTIRFIEIPFSFVKRHISLNLQRNFRGTQTEK